MRSGAVLVLWLCVSLGSQPPSPTQGGHSGRFPQYKDLHNIRDGDLPGAPPAGERFGVVRLPGHPDLNPTAYGRPTHEYLRRYACAADFVAIATARTARAAFTTEGTFIFTNYQLEIESALKGDLDGSTRTVQLLWPGGSLLHKGRTLTATDASFPPLEAAHRYLLFLRQFGSDEFERIPETAGYDLTDKQSRALGAGPLPDRLASDLLLGVARAAISNGCAAGDHNPFDTKLDLPNPNIVASLERMWKRAAGR